MPLPRLLPPRGERFASPCSHAPAWEQGTVSVMYAFPRRSVGTRNYHAGLRLPAHQSPSLWGRVGGSSRRRRHWRGGVSGFAIITISLALLIPPLARLWAMPLPRLLPLRGGGGRFASPCSHAPAWEQETVSVMYAFPRRSVGTRNTLFDPPSGAPAGCALAAPSPPQGGRDLFLLVPMLPRGNKKRSA